MIGWLAIVAAGLTLHLLRKLKPKMASLAFAGLMMIFLLVDFSWVATTTYHGGYVFAVWILFSALFSWPFIFYAYGYFRAKKSCFNLVFFSLTMALIEWLRLYFLSGYPFSPLGLFLDQTFLFQPVVSSFGIYGLSACFMALAIAIDHALHQSYRSLLALGFLAPMLLGCVKWDEKELKTASIALIQPGRELDQKSWMPSSLRQPIPLIQQLKALLQLMKQAGAPDVDLIVMPEGVFGGWVNEPFIPSLLWLQLIEEVFAIGANPASCPSVLTQKEAMRFLADHLQATMIYGSSTYDSLGRAYNGLFFQPPFSDCLEYYKRILVPMGEYLPLDSVRSLASRYGVGGFFSPGKELIFDTGSFQILPSICYEDCFPRFLWSSSTVDADLIVNITNDGWFYPSALPKRHAQLARLRSVEWGCPIVRACEQEMSGIADADGSCRFFPAKEKIEKIQIAWKPRATLYRWLGNRWIPLAWIACAGGQLILFFIRRKHLVLKRTVD